MSSNNTFNLRNEKAARREARGGVPTLELGDATIELPAELPLDVFSPLLDVNLDIAVLARQAYDQYRASAADPKANTTLDMTGVLINLLVLHPNLPADLLQAVKDMGRLLFGDEGYAALLAERPSREDAGAITEWLQEQYGVNLPEASTPDESSETVGSTSPETSTDSAESTPEVSLPAPAIPDSSAPAA